MENITYNVQSQFLGISNYKAMIVLIQEVFIMSIFFSKDNYTFKK